jgi:hypothetical protein
MTRVLLVLGILLLGQQVYGQAANQLTTQLQQPKRYRITTVAQTESNLYETGAREYDAKGRLTIAPSYKFSDNYRATVSASLLQDFEGGREGLLSNAKATVTHLPIKISQDSMIIPVAGLRLPTNVKDRKDNSFVTAALVEASLLTNWTIKNVPFSTIYAVYLTKNFHEFERGRAGNDNTDYSIINYAGIEKYITRKLSILIDGDYSYGRTYRGNPKKLFSVGQSLTYEFSNDLSVTVGHSNGGNAFQANGTDYDVQVFDENRSIVYANVRAVY